MPKLETFNAQPNVQSNVPVRRAVVEDIGSGAGGAQVAQVLTETSNTLMAAQRRVDDRNDTVSRTLAAGAFSDQIIKEAASIQTTKNMADPVVRQDFSTFMNDRLGEAMDAHTGSEDSRARLQVKLTNLMQQQSNLFLGESLKAGRKAIDDAASNTFASIAQRVAEGYPLDQALRDVDAEVDDLEPGMTPGKERSSREDGKARAVAAAYQSAMDGKDTVAARAALSTPGAEQWFSTDKMLAMRSGIIEAERMREKGVQQGKDALDKMAAILGVPVDKLTPEHRRQAAGLTEPKQTLQQRIDTAEKAKGSPLTPDQRNKIIGIHIESGDEGKFGGTLRGIAMNTVLRLNAAYASGQTTPEQDQEYEIAVGELNRRTFGPPDPVTGIRPEISPNLPAFMPESFERRGKSMPGISASAATKTGAPNAEGGPPGAVTENGLPTDLSASGRPRLTFFGVADLVAGPVSALKALGGRTPGIGAAFRPEDVEQARSAVSFMIGDLVRVLSKNPKFAEGERKQIRGELNLDPSAFDTVGAYRSRIIAMGGILEQRAKDALAVSQQATSAAVARQAVDEYAALTVFHKNLGIPPIMKTPEEVREKVPEGDWFRTPDGRLKRNIAVENDG